jgi:hypothetical protein
LCDEGFQLKEGNTFCTPDLVAIAVQDIVADEGVNTITYDMPFGKTSALMIQAELSRYEDAIIQTAGTTNLTFAFLTETSIVFANTTIEQLTQSDKDGLRAAFIVATGAASANVVVSFVSDINAAATLQEAVLESVGDLSYALSGEEGGDRIDDEDPASLGLSHLTPVRRRLLYGINELGDITLISPSAMKVTILAEHIQVSGLQV